MSRTYLLPANRALLSAISLLLPFLLVAACGAADTPAKRVIQSSREQVEQALQHLQASSGGKLPTLYGFVQPGVHPLERYQQGYYQYEILVTSVSPLATSVEISAKITAWYSDDVRNQSNYQLLVSNGRLESDLLDRLESTLKTDDAAKTPPLPPSDSCDNAAESLPDAPSVTRANHLYHASQTPAMSQVQPSAEDSVERRIRQLTREAKALEEVRNSQTRPNDLAVVRASKTPVLSRPTKGAETILIADADDELQVIDMNAEWVHVHLLGPSRGWVQRSQLDVSGVSMPDVTTSKPGPSNTQLFHTTRKETGTFPGNWKPLQGKQVQIVWVEPGEGSAHVSETAGVSYLQSLLRQQYRELSTGPNQVAGVVVVLDSAEGGMVATTFSSLQRWNAGNLSDKSFLKECWFDPLDVFHGSAVGR